MATVGRYGSPDLRLMWANPDSCDLSLNCSYRFSPVTGAILLPQVKEAPGLGCSNRTLQQKMMSTMETFITEAQTWSINASLIKISTICVFGLVFKSAMTKTLYSHMNEHDHMAEPKISRTCSIDCPDTTIDHPHSRISSICGSLAIQQSLDLQQ